MSSKTTKPAAPEPLGDSEGTATQVVAGLEPVHWYLENEDEYMSEKLRKEHERLNSYTFKLCKVAHPLYSAADVAKLQADLAAMTKKADGFFDALQLAAKINAEGQAREQQLREALEYYASFDYSDDSCPVAEDAQQALAIPQDDTALRQWGAKLLEESANESEAEGWMSITLSALRRKATKLREGKK